jgi:hypothetical protein
VTLRQALTRSCAEEGYGPRAVPLVQRRFEAFQISESGRTYPIDGLHAASLEEAKTQAITLRALSHKQHLLIREDGTRIHVFAVRQKSTPRYVHDRHVTRAVRDLYLDLVCSFDGGVL